MTALIFGAGGQVGRALQVAAPPGQQVIAMDRHQCDVSRSAEVRAAIAEIQPRIIFNAAAYTNVDRAEEEEGAAHQANAVAPGILAAAARSAGARLVHLSTDFVFDGAASRPYRPADAPGPLGVYGRTKLAGERAVAAAHPEALIVRTAWVHAPVGANFVNTMLRLMQSRGRVQVVADQIGTPTHAASLAQAIWRLVELDAKGVHHFTDAGVASWDHFAVAIAEEARAIGLLAPDVEIVPINSADYLTAARRPAYSVLDKSATWALLGQAPPHWRVNLRASLQELNTDG